MTDDRRDPDNNSQATSDGAVGRVQNETPDNAAHVDITEAKRFLERLDPTTTKFEFRTLDDNRDRESAALTKTFYGTLGLHAYDLIKLNSAGAGVFITVNATNGKGRAADDIVRVRAGFIDLDGAPLEPVQQYNLEPHIVTESSQGRWHAYWLINNLALEDFTAVQLALIERFHSDPKVHDLPRIMRLPGFFHRKAAPFRSRIVSLHDREPYPASYFGKVEQAPHVSGEKVPATDLTLWLVGEALKVIPTSIQFEDRNHIGMCVWRATDANPYGFKVWSDWLKRSGKYIERKARIRWLHYFKWPPTQLDAGTLFFYAKLVEPGWWERVNEELDDLSNVMEESAKQWQRYLDRQNGGSK
jgi:hypothetical protein